MSKKSIERGLEIKPKVEKGYRLLIGNPLDAQIVNLDPSGLPVRIEGGVIQLDKERLEAERRKLRESLKAAIESGNERMLQIYLQNLQGKEEGLKEAKEDLTEAFRLKDSSRLQLDNLHVNLATEGIAQRNLIRQGLQPELARHPFTFKGAGGRNLDQDEVDIVFTRADESRENFKIIVGSKRGIEGVGIPQEIPDDKFQPDMNTAQKDPSSGVITIPLKAAKDDTLPLATVVEIIKRPIDLVRELAKLEEDAREREREEERRRRQQSSSLYSGPSSSQSGRYVSH